MSHVLRSKPKRKLGNIFAFSSLLFETAKNIYESIQYLMKSWQALSPNL
jgi:hypothetical protein